MSINKFVILVCCVVALNGCAAKRGMFTLDDRSVFKYYFESVFFRHQTHIETIKSWMKQCSEHPNQTCKADYGDYGDAYCIAGCVNDLSRSDGSPIKVFAYGYKNKEEFRRKLDTTYELYESGASGATYLQKLFAQAVLPIAIGAGIGYLATKNGNKSTSTGYSNYGNSSSSDSSYSSGGSSSDDSDDSCRDSKRKAFCKMCKKKSAVWRAAQDETLRCYVRDKSRKSCESLEDKERAVQGDYLKYCLESAPSTK